MTKTPTPITTSKKSATEPVEPTTPESVTNVTIPEPTTPEPTKLKSKMSWAEKMAAMSEVERIAARSKAAHQSRISKAKARGTTPGIAATMRLKAQLARNIERTELLAADRAKIEAELAEIEAQVVAEQAETEGENGQA